MPGKKKIRTLEYIRIYNLLYRKIRNLKTNDVNEFGIRKYRRVNLKKLVDQAMKNNIYPKKIKSFKLTLPRGNGIHTESQKNIVVYL